jgi:light-regulated signal transduction histidine kinase (bacteriophytochrome)
MFSQMPFRKIKVTKPVLAFLVIIFSFLVFYLDLATRDLIAFDIFYFPSILLGTWYLGRTAGRLTVIMTGLMWFLAQWDVAHYDITHMMLGDGAIHLGTFFLIAWMADRVHEKSLLLEEKSKELARSNTELEQFAFRAAHDLRAPLTNIFSFTEFLAEKHQNSEDKETQECADGILRSVQRMNAMIKALLEYATVTKKEKEASPADLEKVIAETLENLRAEIVEKKAEITHDPLPVLATYSGLVGILFQNLIGNALKYCENVPRIHISAERKGKEWIFSVKDNGIGIPEEDRSRVFVMFEKLPTQHPYPGSGIGLATCQKIVERCGGRIWIESPPKPEQGSIFFFTLPVS